jgi:sialate O-acetylesterase
MRDAQAAVARETPRAGIVCTVDLGDAAEIHPSKKSGIGDRLARVALARAYRRDIACSGPVFRSWDPATGEIVFDHAGGLRAAGGEPLGFVAAGPDRQFVPVRAVIDGEKIRIAGNPSAIRYAWANNPEGNLFNRDGLPAFPFRTDSWPLATEGCLEPDDC